MGLFDRFRRREARGANIENPTVPVSAADFLAYFGLNSGDLPAVTIDSALTVPAVWCAVGFLSRTLAALPLHAFRGEAKRDEELEAIVNRIWNPQQGSYKARQYFWQQVFTGGRGLVWIERSGGRVKNLWPLDPAKTTIRRLGLRITYRYNGVEYPAEDVIDVPFMLRSDQISHYGPIAKGAAAISLALAQAKYAGNFFAGGGVPPFAIEGPAPTSAEAYKRAQTQLNEAIQRANKNGDKVFPIPLGHKLTLVGFDPAKGQMAEAMRFQVEEIARVYQLPPAFLQDLSRGTFSNVEQQDLHLVKHLVSQWAVALTDELNLKIFGREARGRYIEHNLNALMRGDFKSRIEGIARAIQSGFMTPNEGRALENREPHGNPAANDLYIQGATVPLGSNKAPAAEAEMGGGKDDGTNL